MHRKCFKKDRRINLYNKIAHDPPIIGMHSRTEGVEDTSHPHLHGGLAVICVPGRIRNTWRKEGWERVMKCHRN